MTEKEIKDFIYDYIHEVLDRYEFDQKEIIGTMRREISEDWLPVIKGYKERMDSIENNIVQHSVGVMNVYQEVEKVRKQLDLMKDLKDRMAEETLPVDEVELTLRIKSYPMNIRVYIDIETNFGEISVAYDYPPMLEGELSESINSAYFKLLNELYDAHKARRGHFIGEEGCKEWMDKHGKTIIKKQPVFSPKFRKENE